MTIPDEWIEAGARALFDLVRNPLRFPKKWEDLSANGQDNYRSQAQHILAAVLPLAMKEAEEALEPLARAADEFDDGAAVSFSLDELRRARAARDKIRGMGCSASS